MLINLSEIPPEGRSFYFTEKTAELNEALQDLIQESPYTVDFSIHPAGNIFEVVGSIHSYLSLECTRCLKDFSLELNHPIHEFLIPTKSPMPRTGRETKVNHSSELDILGPSSTLIDYPHFDASSLIRDLVSLATPDHPVCAESCKGLCQHCGKNLNDEICSCAATHKKEGNPLSPFSKLREIKFN